MKRTQRDRRIIRNIIWAMRDDLKQSPEVNKLAAIRRVYAQRHNLSFGPGPLCEPIWIGK